MSIHVISGTLCKRASSSSARTAALSGGASRPMAATARRAIRASCLVWEKSRRLRQFECTGQVAKPKSSGIWPSIDTGSSSQAKRQEKCKVQSEEVESGESIPNVAMCGGHCSLLCTFHFELFTCRAGGPAATCQTESPAGSAAAARVARVVGCRSDPRGSAVRHQASWQS